MSDTTTAKADTGTEAQNPSSDTDTQAANPTENTTTQTDAKPPEKTFTQADINRIVARETKTAVEKAIADKAAADEEAKLQEQGKYKELVTKREQERDAAIAELKARDEKLATASEILNRDLTARTRDWPPSVKSLVPPDTVDALERFARVTELEPLALDLMNKPARPGAPNGPIPAGGRAVDDKAARDAQANYTRSAF